MKVLTAAQMGGVDRLTIAGGIPGPILMETAAAAVVEYIATHFAPVSDQRIVVVCGKGNNGGDGLAIARQLATRFNPSELHVIRIFELLDLPDFSPTLVVDAVVGTGLRGPATGPALDAIRLINTAFPQAKVVAVDIPSGLSGDSGTPPAEYVLADATVTFTAPKVCHAMPPACNLMGDLVIAPIGSPASLYEDDPTIQLALVTPATIGHLFAPRARDANKGSFGHALIVAGSYGKAGAAAMAGISALRAGAGLVTVACPDSVLPTVAGYYPELMMEPLREIDSLTATRTLAAIGPGIGTADETVDLVWHLYAHLAKPLILDADALNCIAPRRVWPAPGGLRVLTPHPGEMSRLTGRTVKEIQADRIGAARAFAAERGVVLVLKGERTLIAFPDGRVWINPTGSPAMATGGTGDILTGMIAGLMAQFPANPDHAITAAVYLHGLAGELAAKRLTEQVVIATDLLTEFPEAIRAIRHQI